MIDLSTTYMGLKLDNPLVPSSSPLTGNMDDIKRLVDAGARAVVLPSLFEEVVHHEQKQLERYVHLQALGHSEADSYHPVPEDYAGELDSYLQHIQDIKTELGIPVIASLNGISSSGWVDFGKDMQQAGADALELNVYYVAADPQQTADEVENKYVDLLKLLREQITVPVAMKLSSQFSSVGNMVLKLQKAGANSAVMFNRFYQPDIDLETLKIKPQIELSSPVEALMRIRWIALLRGRVELSLAASGGFHNIDAVLKALLAGADAVYVCSVLLEKGPQKYAELLKQLHDWLEEHEYESVMQMQGSVSQACAIDPARFEHNNYFDVIKSYRGNSGAE